MFSVAGVQLEVIDGQSNLEAMKRQLVNLTARFPWVSMAVFSELAVYGTAPKGIQPIDSDIEERLCELASLFDIWLIPGSYFATTEDGVYNRAIVIDPSGAVVGRYHKQFPFLPYETGVQAGREFLVFDVPDAGRFGLSICYDMWFPETSRMLTAMGAEVILHPSLTNTIDRQIELNIARATAATNQCYVFDVNGSGDGGYGQSIVAGPSGDTVHLAGERGEIFPIPIDFERVRWERDNGILGLGQVLKSFRDREVQFPVYQHGEFDSGYLESLGPLSIKMRQ